MGGYEPDPKPWADDGVPEGFHFSLLDPDWDHFEQLMEQALARYRRSRTPASSS